MIGKKEDGKKRGERKGGKWEKRGGEEMNGKKLRE